MAGPDRLNELARSLDERLSLGDEPVAVAVSGGADSAALLWLVRRRTDDVLAIHVFHGLDSSAWMSTAAGQVAAACGVRMELVTVDPAGTSEDDLRRVRLPALESRAGGRPILLGHTADDQAETVMMRIVRGTGVDGLAGIAEVRGRFWHPMLRVRRAEARELAELAGLPFRDDPANDDLGIVRNRIRRQVMPALTEAFGRDPVDPIVRLAGLAARDAVFLEAKAVTIPVERCGASVRVPLGPLATVDASLAARAIRRALAAASGTYPPSADDIARIFDVVAGRRRAAEVAPGLRVGRHGPHLLIEPGGEAVAAVPDSVTVSDGVQWAGFRLRVAPVEGPVVAPLSARRVVVPADLGHHLVIRAIGDDDRVGGRRAMDALADAGVRSEDRRLWPVVTAGGVPVWVPGVRAEGWSTGSPGRYLELVAFREPTWQTSEP